MMRIRSGRTYQSPLQHMQISGHPPQEEAELVADDVHLLLGLHAVLSCGLQEQLGGDLLQRRHLLLPSRKLLPQLLQVGSSEPVSSGFVGYQDFTAAHSPVA